MDEYFTWLGAYNKKRLEYFIRSMVYVSLESGSLASLS